MAASIKMNSSYILQKCRVLLQKSPQISGFQRNPLCTQVKGHIHEKKPAKVDVEEGKTYAWCACGRSKKQPFCDGSHRKDPISGAKLSPPYELQSLKYTAEKSKTLFFCNCKQTGNPPFCDGSHKKL